MSEAPTACGPPWFSEPCVSCGTPLTPSVEACPKCGVRRIPLGTSGPPPVTPSAQPGAGWPSQPPPSWPTPGAYAQPPGYLPAGYGARSGYAPYGQQTNNKATTALVLGIVGLVVCQIVSIFAIIVGREAAREIRYSGGTQTGEGMATAGRVLGWIGVAILVLSILIGIFIATSGALIVTD